MFASLECRVSARDGFRRVYARSYPRWFWWFSGGVVLRFSCGRRPFFGRAPIGRFVRGLPLCGPSYLVDDALRNTRYTPFVRRRTKFGWLVDLEFRGVVAPHGEGPRTRGVLTPGHVGWLTPALEISIHVSGPVETDVSRCLSAFVLLLKLFRVKVRASRRWLCPACLAGLSGVTPFFACFVISMCFYLLRRMASVRERGLLRSSAHVMGRTLVLMLENGPCTRGAATRLLHARRVLEGFLYFVKRTKAKLGTAKADGGNPVENSLYTLTL